MSFRTTAAGRLQIRGVFLALGQLVVLAACVWFVVAALTLTPPHLFLYRRAYAFSKGHHVAGQLSRAVTATKPVCLLMGLSSTREAFDADLMETSYPAYRFLNCGTAGGSIFDVELSTTLAADNHIQVACIVLGLHSHFLKDSWLGMWPAGYLDVLQPASQKEMIPHEIPAERTRTLLEAELRLVWPGERPAQQLDRLVRDGLYRAQGALREGTALPRSAFERIPRELEQYEWYPGGHPQTRWSTEDLERFYAAMEADGLFNPSIYARPEHVASLRRVLTQSQQIARRVVVVLLPESRFARTRLSPFAEPAFDQTLADFRKRGVQVIDQRDRFPDASFDAVYHLLVDARARFSEEFARALRPILDPSAAVPSL